MINAEKKKKAEEVGYGMLEERSWAAIFHSVPQQCLINMMRVKKRRKEIEEESQANLGEKMLQAE